VKPRSVVGVEWLRQCVAEVVPIAFPCIVWSVVRDPVGAEHDLALVIHKDAAGSGVNVVHVPALGEGVRLREVLATPSPVFPSGRT
jgi:hypothetical protein